MGPAEGWVWAVVLVPGGAEAVWREREMLSELSWRRRAPRERSWTKARLGWRRRTIAPAVVEGCVESIGVVMLALQEDDRS